MCSGNEEDAIKMSEEDVERVRELKRVAVEALLEMNRISSQYMGIDADSVDGVTIGLKKRKFHDGPDGGAPPAYDSICTTFYSGGACTYEQCDPPGFTRPCPPISLPPG